MPKKTIEEQLLSRKIGRPSKLFYAFLYPIARAQAKSFHAKVTFKTDFSKEKGPYVLLSNHTSRCDYMFNIPVLKTRFNSVVGYNEFFRSHLKFVAKHACFIPKKNFTPDVFSMKSIMRVLKEGGCITMYPEGMNSISGHSQPVAVGTAHFLKKIGLPVYYSLIKGGYLSMPKYNLNDRKGTAEVELDIMFTPEQLKKLSEEEITDIMNEKLYHDDYKWNLEKQYRFAAKGRIADGLHTLLYHCPKCHSEQHMEGVGDRIVCHNCGNGATIDETYKMTPFDDDCVLPQTQTDWFDMERAIERERVKKDDFFLEEHVRLGMLPKYKYLKKQQTSEIVGEGTLHLDKTGLTYDGSKNGEPFTFHIDIKQLPTYGMCTDVSRFYTFYNGEFVEFYPTHNVVEKFFLCTEELHRQNGGEWQAYKFDTSEKA